MEPDNLARHICALWLGNTVLGYPCPVVGHCGIAISGTLQAVRGGKRLLADHTRVTQTYLKIEGEAQPQHEDVRDQWRDATYAGKLRLYRTPQCKMVNTARRMGRRNSLKMVLDVYTRQRCLHLQSYELPQ